MKKYIFLKARTGFAQGEKAIEFWAENIICFYDDYIKKKEKKKYVRITRKKEMTWNTEFVNTAQCQSHSR